MKTTDRMDDAGVAAQRAAALTPGTELLGPYAGSGLQDPPCLVRRDDGRLVTVSALLYLVAEQIDGRRTDAEVAALVAAADGRDVDADDIAYLIEHKLAPLGIVERDTAVRRVDAAPADSSVLALRLRVRIMPERAHRGVTTFLRHAFHAPVVAIVLVALAGVDLWLVTGGRGATAGAFADIVRDPELLLAVTVLTVMSALFHELGHAAATRYGGATPGAIGAGIYLVWPVFSTDVTDSYRLDRRGRLRTDLGGVYFNLISVVAAVIAFAFTGWAPLLVFAIVGQIETARQFLPFVRLDGYYVVSDLAGVPDLFSYLRPAASRALRRADPAAARLDALTPRARRIIVGWVLLTVPVIAVQLAFLVLVGPRLAGAAAATLYAQGVEVADAVRDGGLGAIGGAVLGLTTIAVPVIGVGSVVLRVVGRTAQRLRARRPVRRSPARVALASTVVATVALAVLVVAPPSFRDSYDDARAVRRSGAADTPARPAEPATATPAVVAPAPEAPAAPTSSAVDAPSPPSTTALPPPIVTAAPPPIATARPASATP